MDFSTGFMAAKFGRHGWITTSVPILKFQNEHEIIEDESEMPGFKEMGGGRKKETVTMKVKAKAQKEKVTVKVKVKAKARKDKVTMKVKAKALKEKAKTGSGKCSEAHKATAEHII